MSFALYLVRLCRFLLCSFTTTLGRFLSMAFQGSFVVCLSRFYLIRNISARLFLFFTYSLGSLLTVVLFLSIRVLYSFPVVIFWCFHTPLEAKKWCTIPGTRAFPPLNFRPTLFVRHFSSNTFLPTLFVRIFHPTFFVRHFSSVTFHSTRPNESLFR